MNRIEKVREYVDNVLLNIPDAAQKRCGYLHLYGVSQNCAMIAMKRRENVELATIAGMLHDIYTYLTMDGIDHAHKGAVVAREILDSLHIFNCKEIDTICSAIHNHSDKDIKHLPFDEVLIDADVMQHCLYNPLFDIHEKEMTRFKNLKAEFGLL
jgi:HD superfamily phosphodiesterase